MTQHKMRNPQKKSILQSFNVFVAHLDANDRLNRLQIKKN